MNTKEQDIVAIKVNEYLAHTTGSENWHSISDNMTVTDGIKFVITETDSMWLLGIIASLNSQTCPLRSKTERFQLWILEEDCVSAWTDTPPSKDPESNGQRLFHGALIPHSFPQSLLPFEFYVSNGVVLLKEEY